MSRDPEQLSIRIRRKKQIKEKITIYQDKQKRNIKRHSAIMALRVFSPPPPFHVLKNPGNYYPKGT